MTDMTLRRYLTQSALDPNLIFLLEDIASSCRVIADHVRNGAFEGNLGSANATNIQGETQKTLDILANDELGVGFSDATRGRLCDAYRCLASEKRSSGKSRGWAWWGVFVYGDCRGAGALTLICLAL